VKNQTAPSSPPDVRDTSQASSSLENPIVSPPREHVSPKETSTGSLSIYEPVIASAPSPDNQPSKGDHGVVLSQPSFRSQKRQATKIRIPLTASLKLPRTEYEASGQIANLMKRIVVSYSGTAFNLQPEIILEEAPPKTVFSMDFDTLEDEGNSPRVPTTKSRENVLESTTSGEQNTPHSSTQAGFPGNASETTPLPTEQNILDPGIQVGTGSPNAKTQAGLSSSSRPTSFNRKILIESLGEVLLGNPLEALVKLILEGLYQGKGRVSPERFVGIMVHTGIDVSGDKIFLSFYFIFLGLTSISLTVWREAGRRLLRF
jgi:hypothetical protein